jgi:hypothetical protein
MELQEIAPGLRRWTAYHREWKDEVGCLWYEAPIELVLVSHGEPVLVDGRNALDRALRQAPSAA